MQRLKKAYWIQFGIIAGIIFTFTFYGSLSGGNALLLLLPFFLSEIFLLHYQGKIPPEEIYYRKSCIFALLDMVSVLAFLSYICNFMFGIFAKEHYNVKGFPIVVILAYALLRKIFIYKNFSYEK